MTDYRFLKACRSEPVDATPIWIMRQAGRYLPEYQAVRSKVSFLELCKTPELAAEVSLQPVDILGVDAAILFSDILIVVEAMGMPLHFDEGPPVLGSPITDKAGVDRLAYRTPKRPCRSSWKPSGSCGGSLSDGSRLSGSPAPRLPWPAI